MADVNAIARRENMELNEAVWQFIWASDEQSLINYISTKYGSRTKSELSPIFMGTAEVSIVRWSAETVETALDFVAQQSLGAVPSQAYFNPPPQLNQRYQPNYHQEQAIQPPPTHYSGQQIPQQNGYNPTGMRVVTAPPRYNVHTENLGAYESREQQAYPQTTEQYLQQQFPTYLDASQLQKLVSGPPPLKSDSSSRKTLGPSQPRTSVGPLQPPPANFTNPPNPTVYTNGYPNYPPQSSYLPSMLVSPPPKRPPHPPRRTDLSPPPNPPFSSEDVPDLPDDFVQSVYESIQPNSSIQPQAASSSSSTPSSPAPASSSTTQAVSAVRPPVCPLFQTQQFCTGRDAAPLPCKGYHPFAQRVCDNVSRGMNCVRDDGVCNMQHPNMTTIMILRANACQKLKIEEKDWPLESTRRGIFLRWATTQKPCTKGPDCDKIACLDSHLIWIPTSNGLKDSPTLLLRSALAAPAGGDSTNLIDVTHDSVHKALVESILARSPDRQWAIKKLTFISNTLLTRNFDTYYNQLAQSLGRLPTTDIVCHGSLKAICYLIAKSGFDRSKITHYAFGFGHYFALKPSVSVGYGKGENTMLLCRVIHDSTHNKFVQQHDFFVVDQDEAINPIYVLEY